ncbi:MAG: electron transport complex subunit RsxC [Paludibacteraceae bacterium]|nr:electron transport complex subunit RsxC [Paludibacteraceae bacterium]
MKTFKIGGVHPQDKKLTAQKPIITLAAPKEAIFPLEQHIGAPAKPIVNVGDRIKTGQMIAEAGGFVSAPVHSSVTGIVSKIAEYTDPQGFSKQAIYIKAEENDEWADGIIISEKLETKTSLDAKEIIKKISDAGIVGLGGACFPTHVKLTPPADCKIDSLIINAVECEPYLTHNHRLMLEKAGEVIIGTRLLMKALGIEKAYIGIESNKMDAVNHLRETAEKLSDFVHIIEIVPLKMKYPQGSEKHLIEAITGREVKSGAIPASVGVVVQNVGTAFAVYEAVQFNKPLIDLFMTVTGSSMTEGGNFRVRMGTSMKEVLDMVGGIPADAEKVIGGGPMMGRCISNIDTPITKRSSAILCLEKQKTVREDVLDCIRCGKCMGTCPMGLEPYLLAKLTEIEDWSELEEHYIMDCIECGCCTFTCPSHRPLLDYVRYGKFKVGTIIRNRK